MELRAARVEDADAIAGVHVAAWRATYRGLFPDEVLDGLSVAEFAERHRRRLLAPNPADARVWVAAGPEGLVGFSIGGSARDADLTADVGEVYAIYLLDPAIGRGLGRRLFARSLASLGEAGKREVVVWVAEANARARRFYEAAGLELESSVPPKNVVIQGRDLGVREVRMRGRLASRPTGPSAMSPPVEPVPPPHAILSRPGRDAMTIETLLQEGWRDHEKDTRGVAERLEAAVSGIEKPEHVGGILQLANHAIGQHLRDWSRAARLAEAAVAKLGNHAPSAGVLCALALARYLSGNVAGGLAAEARAAALQPADAVGILLRTRLQVAEALLAMDRPDDAYALFDAALDLAEALPKESPSNRVAAVALNNFAQGLLDRPARTPGEDARMLRCAKAARVHWLRAGDWTNDERADYLLALVSNALGSHADAVLHAERALTTIEKNGTEDVDAAFLHLALAHAYRGLGLEEAHAKELAEADGLAARFDDASLKEWYEGEAVKARTPAAARAV